MGRFPETGAPDGLQVDESAEIVGRTDVLDVGRSTSVFRSAYFQGRVSDFAYAT